MENKARANRPSVGLRITTAVLFLGILAVSGYMGAMREYRPSVGVPVSYAVMAASDAQEETMTDVRARLNGEREQALALLDSVIAHPDTDSATRENALAQKVQIASRMELEAQIEAVLLQMDISGEAVAGETGMTILASAQDLTDEQVKMRLIHAACAQTGLSPSEMKIILVKK